MTFRWGRTGRAAQKRLLLPEQRHDPPGELRVVHYPSNMPRTRTIKVNGDVGRRVAFGSENISDTALGAGKITVAARDGEPPVSWSAVTTTSVPGVRSAKSIAAATARSKSRISASIFSASLPCDAPSISEPSTISTKPRPTESALWASISSAFCVAQRG